MTTDDLRTRAREVAEERFADLVVDSAPVYTRQSVRYYQQGAFINGALWHAAQQPSREQLRTEFLYRLRTVAAHYRAAGKHGDPVEPGWIEREADLAVLALWNGADDG